MTLKRFLKEYGWQTVFISVTCLFFTIMFYGLIGGAKESNARHESCNKLNMEYYTAQDSIFCIDKEGNAHYVKIECEKISWLEYNCIPRIISIGEIRTK